MSDEEYEALKKWAKRTERQTREYEEYLEKTDKEHSRIVVLCFIGLLLLILMPFIVEMCSPR